MSPVAALLLVGAGIHTLDRTAAAGAAPPARAMRIDRGRITWLGSDPHQAPPVDEVVDLGTAWVTPAFVDAHVHGTATGLAVTGLSLAGTHSAGDCLGRLRAFAASTDADVILGHGWDDFAWPEGRPMAASEVSAAAPGRTVLLARVDVHSCVVDLATLRSLPLETLDGVDRDADGLPTGWLREAASEAARRLVLARLADSHLAEARQAACVRAGGLGIASIHEMGHPGLSGWDDALAWVQGRWPIEVVTWWAELDPELRCAAHGLRPGGDLFLDGSIGSCTAAVSTPYADHGGTGELFHDDDAVGAFFAAATAARTGAGVHAIGDRAIEQALRALEAAGDGQGLEAVRASRHRLEHVELATADHVRRMARLGVTASVQPAFDAEWGGDDRLYAKRFGGRAARETNPLRWFVEAGVPLAFGSDSTVTPLGPWGAVEAAERHLGGLGVDRLTALFAHTRGGHHAAGHDDVGVLAPGMRADVAAWDADPLAVDEPTQLRCVLTLAAGSMVHGVT